MHQRSGETWYVRNRSLSGQWFGIGLSKIEKIIWDKYVTPNNNNNRVLIEFLKIEFTDNYEAEQLLKEVDIHSVTGILKSYLRELPEALFTDLLYPKLFDIYNKYSNFNETGRIDDLQRAFAELPEPNRESINFILDHLIRYVNINIIVN